MASNASLAKQNYVTITMLFALNAFDDELFKLVGIMLRARVKQQHHEGTNGYGKGFIENLKLCTEN